MTINIQEDRKDCILVESLLLYIDYNILKTDNIYIKECQWLYSFHKESSAGQLKKYIAEIFSLIDYELRAWS